jgi:hypothetical protein
MNFAKAFIAAIVLTMSFAPAAHAGTKILATAPAALGANRLHCDITNAGTSPADVTIEIMDYAGTVVHGPYVTTIQPGTGDYLGPTLNAAAAWCRFTVTTGSTKLLRGIAVYDDSATYNMIILAQ